MNFLRPIIIFIVSILFAGICFGQEYDKSFYILDQIDLSKVESYEKSLLDSCLTVFHQEKDRREKVEAMSMYIEESLDINLWPRYNDFLQSYLNEHINKESSFYLEHQASIINNRGYYFEEIGEADNAIECYLESIRIDKENGIEDGLVSSYANLGNMFQYKGDYTKALDYINKGLDLAIKYKDSNGISHCYNYMGSVYYESDNMDLALENYTKSLEVREAIKNQAGIASALSNIAIIHRYNENFEEAEKAQRRSLNISIELNDVDGLGTNYNNMGITLERLGDSVAALEHYEKALGYFEASSDLYGISVCSLNASTIMFGQKRYRPAKLHALTSYQYAMKLGYPAEIKDASETLYELYLQERDYKKALEFYTQAEAMADTLETEANTRALIQQAEEYRYEKQATADSIRNQEALKVKNAEIAANQAESKVQKQRSTYLLIGLGLVALFGLFMFHRFRITRKQKDIIDEQKNAVESQKTRIEEQHELLEETHQEISDSIKYAERLQQAIMPSQLDLKKGLGEGFVLFEPKDVVSGDFYWMQHLENSVLFAAADCTGHGVPGALVSVVCSNALNRSVKEFNLIHPNDILNKTRELVIETFARSGKDVRDGMDIALCALNGEKLTYSGANNPLWIVRKTGLITNLQREDSRSVIGENVSLVEYKPNKQPVGLYEQMKDFQQIEIELFEGDTIYIFTDGFADQFGGVKGKKLKYKPFKKLLLDVNNLSINDQKQKLKTAFVEWKGDYEQIDDVCIIGVKI